MFRFGAIGPRVTGNLSFRKLSLRRPRAHPFSRLSREHHGQRAVGCAAIGGLAGAAIGGMPAGHASGALTGAAVGAAGGAIVGAATTPEPVAVDGQMPVAAQSRVITPPQPGPAPVRAGVNPSHQGSTPQNCRYGTMMHHGSPVCAPLTPHGTEWLGKSWQ